MMDDRPRSYAAGIAFSELKTRPHGFAVGIEFAGGAPEPGEQRVIYPQGIPRTDGVGEHGVKLFHSFANPAGWDSLELGDSLIWNNTQIAKPAGIAPANGYGLSRIWNKSQIAKPSGFESLATSSSATIINRNRYILHGGSDYLRLGTGHEVWLWERHIKLEGRGPHTLAFGTQWASHYLRYVTANSPADLLGMGRPWAVEDPRYLNPKPIEPINITDRHIVGGLRFIEPVGTEMTEWGTRIIPQSNTLYHHGLSMQAFGDHELKNHLTYVKPKGFRSHPDETLRFGYQHVWNLRQVVQQQYDPNDGLNPPPFGQWTKIENRNREPKAFGWVSSRFGYQFIWNKATPIKPGGIAAPENEPHYKAGSVQHLNRPLEATGIDSMTVSRWSVVYNAADPLRAKGFDALVADHGHTIENRSRLYRNVGGFEAVEVGQPFIAEAIRGITFEQRYSIEPPRIDLPTVDLYTRYVEDATAGEGKYGVGLPSLSVHWRIIQPKWAFHPPAFIGEPFLHNVTPEVRAHGHNSEEYGNAFIRTQWREVRGEGSNTEMFGRALIRDRRHWVEFTGAIPPPNMLPGPVLTRIGGLPDKQWVSPRGWFVEVVPKPIAGAQELYPQGLDALRFGGGTEVLANSIRVESGIYPGFFGKPFTSLKNREVSVDDNGIAPKTAVGMPRSSPHTIYAVKEAPEQAKRNHLPGSLHYVGENVNGAGWNKGLGRPMVSILHRWVRPSGIQAMDRTDAGRTVHKIYNAKSWIEPKPIKPLPVGIPEIPGTKAVEQYGSVEFMVFGKPKVAPPPYTGPQYIKPNGMQALATGAQEVEFLHRKRTLTGWNSLQMGASKPGDTPYMWQGLRVGPMVPVMIEGFDASSTGEPWISFRVREVLPEGYNAMASEYDLENFHARMRVWRRDESIPSTLITAGGIDGLTAGVPNIANRVHYILPDGNAEQYRKGAPNA